MNTNYRSQLKQLATTLDFTTSYIARINITDDSLRGVWRVMIQSQGSYSIQVLGKSRISFSEDLYSIDTSGFRKIEGRPSQG